MGYFERYGITVELLVGPLISNKIGFYWRFLIGINNSN